MTANNSPTDIIFILDESGSMESMGKEPIQSINNFINDQKKVLLNDDATFTLYKFNSIVTLVYDDILLQSVPEFTDYNPDDATALYDAIGKAIDNKKMKRRFDNVICVILTDGCENSSSNFSIDSIKESIQTMEREHGWTFIYLGANQDAFKVGSTIGFTHCATFAANSEGLKNITRQVSNTVSLHRSGSIEPDFDVFSQTTYSKLPIASIDSNI